MKNLVTSLVSATFLLGTGISPALADEKSELAKYIEASPRVQNLIRGSSYFDPSRAGEFSHEANRVANRILRIAGKDLPEKEKNVAIVKNGMRLRRAVVRVAESTASPDPFKGVNKAAKTQLAMNALSLRPKARIIPSYGRAEHFEHLADLMRRALDNSPSGARLGTVPVNRFTRPMLISHRNLRFAELKAAKWHKVVAAEEAKHLLRGVKLRRGAAGAAALAGLVVASSMTGENENTSELAVAGDTFRLLPSDAIQSPAGASPQASSGGGAL